MSNLNDRLNRLPIRPFTKQDIVHHLWPSAAGGPGNRSSDLDWTPYFVYYEAQCAAAMHEQGKHIVAREHKHIIDVAEKMRQGRPQEEIRTYLKALFTGATTLPDEDEIIENTVDLVARVYLMVNVSTSKSTVTQGARLSWNARTLHQLLQDTFQKSHDTVVRFEKDFTALNMERMTNITIRWTNNLADHLRMVEDDRVVAIFHHATFLSRQKDNPVFPSGFIDETIRTHALLFPKQDKEGIKWLRTAHSSRRIDRYLMCCDRLSVEDRQIQNFEFWNHRLVILKQAFDESRPIKIRQWWYDRRDGYLWYTFWFALCVLVLTFTFGTIQSILAGLQVPKSDHTLC